MRRNLRQCGCWLALCFLGCSFLASQNPTPPATPAPAPATSAAPSPSAPVPAHPFQDAIYVETIGCSPEPVSEFCSNVADRFYTVNLAGKAYVLRRGYSYEQRAVFGATDGAAFFFMETNILAKQVPNTPVQMRFREGGVDVRVLQKPSNGRRPQYKGSHYEIAISQIEPSHAPPAAHP